MKKYRMTLEINLKSSCGSLKDIERELEYFNLSNKEAIEVKVREIKEVLCE